MSTPNQNTQTNFDDILNIKQHFNYIYNYDEIPEINFVPFNGQSYKPQGFFQMIIKDSVYPSPDSISAIKNFQKMITGEKIVILKQFSPELNMDCYKRWYASTLMITNHGKYIWLVFDNSFILYNLYKCVSFDYNFWIPINYIKIIKESLNNCNLVGHPEAGAVNEPPTFISILETIKQLSTEYQDKIDKLEQKSKSEVPKWCQQRINQCVIPTMPTTSSVPKEAQSVDQFRGYNIEGYSRQFGGAPFNQHYL
jgi:hypothetical protein